MSRFCKDTLVNLSDSTREYLLELTDAAIHRHIRVEWAVIITFLLTLPFKIFYFIWLWSEGSLSEYGFIPRYIAYIHVFIFLVLAAIHRIAMRNLLGLKFALNVTRPNQVASDVDNNKNKAAPQSPSSAD